MAKRPSKHLRPVRPLSPSLAGRATRHDGDWVVQPLGAGRSTKPYLCPGCNRAVAVGSAHVVTWPAVPPLGSSSSVEHRRHWHSSCWARRA